MQNIYLFEKTVTRPEIYTKIYGALLDIKFEQLEPSSLWLPDYFKKEEVDILGKIARMLISHEDIYETQFTLADLKTALSSLPREGVLIACSIFAIALSVRDGSSIHAQRELAAQFFPKQKLPRINEFLANKRFLFFEAVIETWFHPIPLDLGS